MHNHFSALGGRNVWRQRREVTNWKIGRKPPKESSEPLFLPGKERHGRGKGEKLRGSSLGKEAQGIGARARSMWEQSFATSTFGWKLWSSSGQSLELMTHLGEFKILG